MTQIVLKAKPGSILIDPSKAAVIVVDMQNDFGSKGGMFDRAGIDISGIQRRLRRLQQPSPLLGAPA